MDASTTPTSNLTGWRHNEVLDILRSIHKSGAVPEGVRLALLIEGGALRGVVSCGYALALSEYINDRKFSWICGASSGGLNAVYMAAHSLDVALKVYAENATDPQCTNIWKFPNVLNVDWLVDNWMFGARMFDLETMRASTAEIRIVLTDLRDGSPHYFDARRAPVEKLKQAMKATSYAPLVTENRQTIDGVPYGDGAIADTFGYDHAIENGATHIVCLATRPQGYRKSIGAVEGALYRLRLAGHTPEYVDAFFRRAPSYDKSLDLLYAGGEGAVPSLVIAPRTKSEIPSSIETSASKIGALGKLATEEARRQLRVVFDSA